MNERDPELEKLYREHSREEPPSALDAKILAAAHRAVESGPRKVGEATRPQRWWMPLAAAAAIGVVAIGVIQQVPKETAIDATSVATAPTTPAPAPARDVAPPPPAQEKATTNERDSLPLDANALAKKQKEAVVNASPPPPPAAAPAAKPAMPRSSMETEQTRRENKVVADRLAGADKPLAEPTPFPAAPERQKTEVAASVEAKRDMPMEQSITDARKDAFREGQRQAAAPAGAPAPPATTAPPPAPAPAPAQLSADRMRAQSQTGAAGAIAQSKNVDEEMRAFARDPDAWIARIRKLRDEGNTAQALRELKEFRALVPDAERRLPADLRALQP
jgi:hypothetical protein